jgi:hypothetical protein
MRREKTRMVDDSPARAARDASSDNDDHGSDSSSEHDEDGSDSDASSEFSFSSTSDGHAME